MVPLWLSYWILSIIMPSLILFLITFPCIMLFYWSRDSGSK